MLALANQKIGHEARDYFRSRAGVDFYFGSITRLVGRARGRDFVPVLPNRKVPQGNNAGHALGSLSFPLFPFFLFNFWKYLSPPPFHCLFLFLL